MDNQDDFIFLLDSMGELVAKNNNPTKAIITNAGNGDKYISTLTEIKQGDRIRYNGLYWLIVESIDNKRYNKYKCVMRACNHIIGFKIDDNPVCIPVIAYGSSIGVTENKFFTIPENEIILTMQKNSTTELIKINDTFAKWGTAWKVYGIDHTKTGLLNLHCRSEAIGDEEEYTCTIAGDITESDWYIMITGETELEPENTYSYSAKVYDGDDVEHDDFNIVWSLNPEANSTISQDGILNVHPDDSVITIYATLEGFEIKGELLVQVQGEEEITYSLEGADAIRVDQSANYTANKFLDGVLDPNAQFTFSIDYRGESSSIATLNAISNTECTIKCNSYPYYITLIAEDIETGETVQKEIYLRGWF